MATTTQPFSSNRMLAAKFEHLLKKVTANRPHDDLEIIRKAYGFSLTHHEGQVRASGEPYLIHPLEVAIVLADMKLDSTAISAGLLHDAIEDTPVTNADIQREFGDQVAHIVEGVTKIDKIDFASREERQAENVRKMVLAMVDDIRVVLIKLADRLHNMRTLNHLPEIRQLSVARETLEIYAPLAHRLGMGKVRGELEDLAFGYVDPIGYEQVRAAVESRRKAGEKFLAGVVKTLQEKLKENVVEALVESRIKRLYSIHQKLVRQRITFDQVYDLLALRIITKSVKDCYTVLGAIHQMWRPVPGRIKDFIAMPRPNLYQSLHTTVITESGTQFEVQIRTEEMHKMAEEGIAAHWKYKDGQPVSAKDEKRLAWLRQVVEWQQDIKDPSEFLSTLKVDLYPEEVYTFTPKGRVVILPRDASTIDFAYAIHTEVGHSCVGARVNGRIVPLRCKLHHGDVVEIMTQAAHNPSRDWLAFTKSSRARNKIKHWLNVHQRERAIEIGKKLIEKLARKFQLAFKNFDEKQMEKVAREYGLGSGQDLLAGIGYGKFSARQILAKLSPQVTEEGATPEDAKPAGALSSMIRRVFGQSAESAAIKVRGHDDLLVYRARCCNPIRGEAIVGYVTRGKGVAVHAISCSNVTNLMYEADRRIAVEWAKPLKSTGSSTYPVKLAVFCDNRAGMLKQLTSVISDDNTNIRNIEARTADREATIDMVIDIEDVKHLERIMAGLRKIPGIRDVQRLGKV
ncbi:MAG TPA: bifunctional (p)ppGpp synthetase/guanosine-3',5'-bis(diphosphate) 3'-pyrophosphohydrolase [Candidatus Saccharimonadales bacterium]|jgi:guanosine-3',5'-bis(diphosphate) 3'-pyrophosphohydrolase|nr:bifunctional (p)ppGpp synthetase/guanosine-3',5'-bis(diphosphate) 3'-pyrophosphohydrolase [Candidatus Saccharimonadales bacterium]